VKTQKIDAQYITRYLYGRFSLQNKVACHNTYFGTFESDFIFMTHAGYINEIEVKISKSDYKNDFKKTMMVNDQDENGRHCGMKEVNRHQLLKTGETGYKHFYFAMPEELAELVISDEYAKDFVLPDHCGLLSVGRWVRKLVEAPKLPGTKKFDTAAYIRIMSPHYYKSLMRIRQCGSL